MKNIFGTIAKSYKYSYHDDLDRVIVASNKLIKSDLILVDALIALGKYPKIFKTIFLGDDILEIDKICSQIIGFNPRSVKHINIAEKELLIKKRKSNLKGDSTKAELIDKFPNVNHYKQKILWDMQLLMVNLYAQLIGDIIPPILVE
jgi:uncharacterized protein (DUF362 family)